MASVQINIPDEQVAALTVKAAVQGLTLEDWLQKMALEESFRDADRQSKQAAAATILELQKSVKPDPKGWTIRDYINHGRR